MASSRDVDKCVCEYWFGFGKCKTFFIDAVTLAQPLFAASCVERRDTFIEDIETPVDKYRRIEVVESVFDLLAIIVGPSRWHHLNFADFILPEFVTRAEIQYMQQGMTFETVASAILDVLCEYDSKKICLWIHRHLHHSAL